jgi:adenylylsulfate kinase-like enzyme
MSKEITIIVAGKPTSGKTTIGQIIQEALTQKGIKVRLFDNEKFNTETLDKRTKAVAEKTSVTIRTVPVTRDLTRTDLTSNG